MPRKAIRARQAKRLAKSRTTPDPVRVKRILSRTAEEAQRFAVDAARLMEDDKCEDVVVLDLRGLSPVCDFFIIGTGTSDRQMRAVSDHVIELAGRYQDEPYTVSGYEDGVWVVVDFVDVVVHLFDPERRAYYDLESLWGDGKRVPWGR